MSTPVRIAAPRPPEPAAPFHFPVVATTAPMLASVVLWAVTGSPFTLVFAALGPVIAVASLADSRISARRSARREAKRFASELAGARTALERAHALERADLDERHPSGAALVRRRGADPGRWRGPDAIALGRRPVRSTVVFDRVPAAGEPAELAELAEQAGRLADAPMLVATQPGTSVGIGVCGREPYATAVLRGWAVQLARQLPPDQWACGQRGAAWATGLPHAPRNPPEHAGIRFSAADGTTITLAVSAHEDALPAACTIVVALGEGGEAKLLWHPDPAVRGEIEVQPVAEREAGEWAVAMRDEAARSGLLRAGSALPDHVALADLPAGAPAGSLGARFAITAGGPLDIDLVSHGPHAVIGGTTGSGKSELLIAWVIALASRYPPSEVAFLLVDFKGGSAFASLTALPHTTGTITDLDAAGALRALASLRAEVRRREHALSIAGARDVTGAPGLGRLVIVVDEFAAMLGEHPDLHALFADLAARGRSLGVHLVLCTQRPAGAVRDGVLANADLRISLRVNNRADSIAVVGTDGAAAIPARARGRALVSLAGADAELVQFALAGEGDIAAAAARWAGSEPARRPWLEPLPAAVPLGELPAAFEGHRFGLLDRPEEQRREVASWVPERQGGLLVLGGARSGVSTAIATIAEAAGARWLPRGAEAAWDKVARELGDPRPGVLVMDDVDSLLGRFPPEHRAEFADRLVRLARDAPAGSLHLAAGMRRVPGELQVFAGLLPARLLLRHASRHDLVLAGGDGASHDPSLGPGAGTWQDARVQVAIGSTVPPADPAPLVESLAAEQPIAVVTTRTAAVVARLTACGYRVLPVSAPQSVVGTAVVGDVEEWQSHWGALAALRPDAAIVFDGCTGTDLRQLARTRSHPPPLQPHQAWLLGPDGDVLRTVLPGA